MELKPQHQQSLEGLTLDRLCFDTFNTESGKELLKRLRKTYIEDSYFKRGDYAEFGGIGNYLFYMHGHANLVRFIEQQAAAHALKR